MAWGGGGGCAALGGRTGVGGAALQSLKANGRSDLRSIATDLSTGNIKGRQGTAAAAGGGGVLTRCPRTSQRGAAAPPVNHSRAGASTVCARY